MYRTMMGGGCQGKTGATGGTGWMVEKGLTGVFSLLGESDEEG